MWELQKILDEYKRSQGSIPRVYIKANLKEMAVLNISS